MKQSVILTANEKPIQGEYYNAPQAKLIRDKSSTNDEGRIVIRALVAILYQLRNLHVHGELIPSNKTKKIYQHAYLIIQMLLPSLTVQHSKKKKI